MSNLQWWGWVLLVIAVLVYLFITGLVGWSAQSLVKDYATEAARYKKTADRFADQLKLHAPESSFYANLEKRRDGHAHIYRMKRIQAKFAYATFLTCFLWPLWLVFYALVGIVTTLLKTHRVMKGT